MKIYISIPISGKNLRKQMSLASETAERLKGMGHEPVNPFDTPAAPSHLNEREEYAYYMGRDIEQLLLCDAVLFCKGYKDSRGCRIEEQTAVLCGLKMYYSIKDIEE